MLVLDWVVFKGVEILNNQTRIEVVKVVLNIKKNKSTSQYFPGIHSGDEEREG